MRKIFMAAMAAVVMLMVGLVGTQQASATPIPADANGYKFWSPSICVDGSAINGSYYQVAYLAQQWNLRVNNANLLALDYSNDCAADGYPPSRRMVINIYHGGETNSNCSAKVNQEYTTVNGYKRWTNGPGIYINQDNPGCIGNQGRRDKMVSASIGYLLGLSYLNSSGYNSRVMNFTDYSWTYATIPDQNSGNTLAAIYAYAYCQPFGTVC